MFSLGSGAFSWSSKKQDIVVLSLSEEEYVVAIASACQTVWLRRLLTDFLQEQEGVTVIFCDNKESISISKNLVFHSRTKHIDFRCHFIRNLVAEETIALKCCGTDEQVADIFTKSLPHVKHEYFRLKMGVTRFEARGNVE